MKKRIIYFICSAFLLSPAGLQAQKPAPSIDLRGHIVGKGKPYPDKIALRWNVDNYQAFRQFVADGIVIDRLILGKDNKAEAGGWVRITPDTIRAMSLQEFNTPDLKTDTARIIMAQSLYGKSEYDKKAGLIGQIRLQDEEQQNRYVTASLYAAISPRAALAAGLGFEDKLVPDTAKKYVYRLCPVRPLKNAIKIDTGFIYVVGKDLYAHEEYSGLTAAGDEKSIVLKWPRNSSPFSGYYIERSEDKRNFKQLTESIYLPATDTVQSNIYYYYADSVANYRKYYYRLTGVNAFGEKIRFKDTVWAMGVDRTPPASPILKFERKEKELSFSWSKSPDKDLQGYYLLQGKGVSGADSMAVKHMLTPDATTQNLTLPADFRSSYYRLMLADTAGNVNYSNSVYVFVPDTVPPAAPAGLQGKVDSAGMVTLRWKPDSTEALRGYKVLTANQEDHQFIPVSDLVADTAFTFSTTLNTLTRHLFVRVVAVDASYNTSEMSEMLRLERPDTIRPPRPVILNYYSATGGIKLEWSGDHSDDFAYYELYRRQAEESTWQSLLKTKEQSYTDSGALAGKVYEYSLKSVDSSGLASAFAFPLHVKASRGAVRTALSFSAAWNSSKKQVDFTWTRPAAPVNFFILYKDTGKGIAIYKSIPGSQTTFSEAASGLASNTYGLKVIYADKTESDIVMNK